MIFINLIHQTAIINEYNHNIHILFNMLNIHTFVMNEDRLKSRISHHQNILHTFHNILSKLFQSLAK